MALFSLVTIAAKAQLKVGDNPTSINASSVLEMESTNKGMLLPRVALTGTANVAPLATHVAGMSVYNTATAGDVTPGYYYDDGTKWVRLADAAAITSGPWVDSTGAVILKLLSDGVTTRPAGTQIALSDNGYFGIGTSVPVSKLEVAGSALIGGSLHVSRPGEVPSEDGLYIRWNDPLSAASTDPVHTLLGMTSFINNKGTGVGGFIFANTADGTAFTQLLRILANGNVGIGTITPGTKLSVVGLPVFANNTAAASLSEGDFYRTSTGQVMVKY